MNELEGGPEEPGAPTTGLWPLPHDLEVEAGKKNAAVFRAWEFLSDKARSGQTFSIEDMNAAAGWSGQTARTYITKQWRKFLDDVDGGRYRVNRRFLRLTRRDFLKSFTQSRQLLGKYRRFIHPAVLSYEFLLPLTRERELRRSLDQLFYEDTLKGLINQADLDEFRAFLPGVQGETDEEYTNRLVGVTSDYFGGYSIVHVQGRFRAASVATRQMASSIMTEGGDYLIDETTASVRFICPLKVDSGDFGEDIGSVTDVTKRVPQNFLGTIDLQQEIELIREIFFAFFVEAVADIVQGEDEIWLIETSPLGQKLFKWISVFG